MYLIRDYTTLKEQSQKNKTLVTKAIQEVVDRVLYTMGNEPNKSKVIHESDLSFKGYFHMSEQIILKIKSLLCTHGVKNAINIHISINDKNNVMLITIDWTHLVYNLKEGERMYTELMDGLYKDLIIPAIELELNELFISTEKMLSYLEKYINYEHSKITEMAHGILTSLDFNTDIINTDDKYGVIIYFNK